METALYRVSFIAISSLDCCFIIFIVVVLKITLGINGFVVFTYKGEYAVNNGLKLILIEYLVSY